MKEIPEISPISIKPLSDITQGIKKHYLLLAAVELEIFDFLIKPKTAREVAETLETDKRLTEKFLNSLVAIDLLVKNDAIYGNTPLAKTYLTKNSPYYQGNIIRLMRGKRVERWALLTEILKEGAVAPSCDCHDSDDLPRDYVQPSQNDNSDKTNEERFTLAMSEGAMRGSLQKIRDTLAELPEFGNAKKLLDLGGGHGLYAIAFSKINHHLISYVFDYSQVLNITKQFIAKYGMTDRVRTIAGDFTKDDWGSKDYDIIFASDCLYYAEEKLLPILHNIKNNLVKGGLFLSKHWTLNNDKTSPSSAALWDLGVSLRSEKPMHTYTQQEYIKTLEIAGFNGIEIFDVSLSAKTTILFAARK